MVEVAFVNVSHPGQIRSRRVQGEIRRHVMKDIGRARRKKPRVQVIPLEVRMPSPTAIQTVPSVFREKRGTISPSKSMLVPRVGWALTPSGILGVDLDQRILQIIYYRTANPIA